MKNIKSKIDWENRFIEEKIIWKYSGQGPHASYILSDKHSDFYINSDCLTINPAFTREACSSLYEILKEHLQIKPDWILTYPPFGSHIGFCLAELLGCKFSYIKSLQEPEIYFDLKENETVLLCADDFTSGTCIKKIKEAALRKKVKIIDLIAVIANLSNSSTFQNMQIISLMNKEINIWDADDCPLCKNGSLALKARDNWLDLIQ
jgi:orotate phosphoribosyltransferase